MNGQPVEFQCYTLKDEGGNDKLRDLGQSIGFNVGWSAERGMFVETDQPYDPANEKGSPFPL